MKLWGILWLAVFCLWLAGGAELVTINPGGDLRLGGDANLFWFHSGPNWSTNKRMNRTTFIGVDGKAGEEVAGRFAVNGSESFEFRSSLTKQQKGVWVYRASFRSLSGKPIGGILYQAMDVPVDKVFAPLVNDRRIAMDPVYKKLTVFETSGKERTNNTVAFQTAAGQITLHGDFQVRIQDNRHFKQPFFHLRLTFPGCSGNVTQAEVSFTIRLESLHSTPVDLRKAANMAFADKTADDGQGGWSDQGPDNDMSALSPGLLNLGGIDFLILDPAKNDQKSCLVFSGQPARRFPPAGAVVPATPEAHRYLYLLHGAAWVPAFKEEIGRVLVEYTDDSQSVFPVRNGVDVGNWWRPAMSLPNAFLGWRGTNAGGAVGLFVSHFRLAGKPVRRISFEPVRGVWMVAAVSFANLPLERPLDKPCVVTAGKEWAPVDFDGSIRKGSALDFSRLTDGPAGKYGWVVVNSDGRFVFEKRPGKTIRFWGSNLAQSVLFPTHAEADRLADTLAANGYNSIRLHQFERGLMDRRANDTLTFDQEKLDRFFYLIAALKARGLYLCTDIFATRPIRPGDRIAECASADGMERKVLNFFSADAMRNWKEYAERLLKTRNPYTGLTLAEDPALYMVCLDNEAPILSTWNQFPKVAHVPEEAFRRHLRAMNQDIPADRAGYREAFNRYLRERQFITQREQKDFLRRLGCRFLITNLNNDSYPELQPFRQELDLVDLHCYHDHPTYPQARWGLPVAFQQHSPVANELRALTGAATTRIFGKPFVVTELDFCAPNRYRSCGGVLAGAFGALQAHDAIYRFTYTHSLANLSKAAPLHGFDTIFDPVRAMSDRQSSLLFLRGDVAESREAAAFGWSEAFLARSPRAYPREFVRLGLYGKVGALPVGSAGKVPLLDPERWHETLPPGFAAALEAQRKGVLTSSSGELTLWPAENRVRLITPLSEAAVLEQGEFKGNVLRLSGVDAFATVSLHSMDDLPLSESGDMLLFFLTDAANSGMRFSSDKKTLLENWGELPLLVRRGGAGVSLKFSRDFPVRVERLKLDGSPAGSVPVVSLNGVSEFRVDSGEALVYRVTRKISRN